MLAFALPLEKPVFAEPAALLAFLSLLVLLIFGLARLRALAWFFRHLPPLIWTYFLPMLCSSLGIIPSESPLYRPFMSEVVLPLILVWLLVPCDTRAIVRLGPKAVAMMLVGTLGVVLGALLSYGLVHDRLGPDAWRGVASLSGSWIGGSPNLTAVAESLNTESTLIGKLIVVDTVCAYTWLGVLVALSSYQLRIDRASGANNRIIQELAARLSQRHAERARPITLLDFAALLALGLVVSQVGLWAGAHVGGWVETREAGGGVWATLRLSQVLSGYGWGILLITGVCVALSLTRARNLDDAGASTLGSYTLCLLLTTFGARADLRLIQPEDGWLFVMGAIWITTHAVVLLVGMRLLRAPLFLASTASMANIGGTASAPVVAAAYHPSLAPVGLVMAIMGSLIGTPVALLVVAKLCAWIAGAS